MRNFRIISLLLSFVIFGYTAALAQTTEKPVKATPAVSTPSDNLVAGLTGRNDRYRIGFQDILEIQVFNRPNLTQRVPVSPNGTILLFRLERPVVAVCKTEGELAVDIEKAYSEKYLKDPRVRVIVAEQKSQSIAVMGAVERPANYFINRRVHLLEVLALAGGPSKEAGTRLLVARTGSSTNCREKGDDTDGDQIAVVDFKIRDVQQGKETFWMQPGDVVSVLDADVIYVYGDVAEQGAYRVREPITLTQAIASAKGLRPTAKKGKVRILRQKPSGGREELTFDLAQIDKGKVEDPFLEPSDIVAVSEDQTKVILRGITNMIKSSVPSALYRFPL